jgi:cold shock CspA family protein
MRELGTVRRFDFGRGWGFITADRRNLNLFVRIRDIH